MHLQPLYGACERYGGEVAADLFERGLCLPSSSSLSPSDQDRVIEIVRGLARSRGRRLSAVADAGRRGERHAASR